jgi:nucleotide-binding universal stress UspA family protein
MYQHILIPTDGSNLAEKAVLHGIALAKEIGAKITAASRSRSTSSRSNRRCSSASYKKRTEEMAARTLGAVANAAKAVGIAYETVHVEDEHPYKTIIDTAESK